MAGGFLPADVAYALSHYQTSVLFPSGMFFGYLLNLVDIVKVLYI